MTAPHRDLVVMCAVTFAAATAAMVPVMLPLRVAGAVVAATIVAAGLWWSLGHFGPHAVYYARGGPGAVIYVGQMRRRRDSVGPADFTERIAEHLADDGEDWKRGIVAENCTVARRCWTLAGLSWSERCRIRALSAASRRGLCAPLRNELLLARDSRHTLLVAWYSVESRLAVDDGAVWHRPVRGVTGEAAWAADPVDVGADDGDELEPDDEPVDVTAGYERPAGRRWPTMIALGPLSPPPRDRGTSASRAPSGPGGGGTRGQSGGGQGDKGDSVAAGDAVRDGHETAVNVDSGSSVGGSAMTAAEAAERRREREREKKRRQRARRATGGTGEAA